MKKLILALSLALFSSASLFAAFGTTGTTTLQVTVGTEAAIEVNTATTTLTNVASIFNDYTGTTDLMYKIRTTNGTGTGTITLQVTSDFAPAGGPSVTTPPTAGDTLAYTCTVAAPGTGCAGSVTSSTASATTVASFGAGAKSTKAGNSASVGWTLTNDPTYATGTYASTVTFTISST